jgi:Mrp family chromosome partitioning ATPase
MISELRKRYDKIIIDTPPVAIVSDALIILPLMDGWLYSLYFNKVRRKVAQFSAHRMLETNVPCFGAVLNGLTGGQGGYYYSHYYHKSYKDYYVTKSEEMNGNGPKIVEAEIPRRGSDQRR